jgi:membrane protease YdiL (CAAX protease family)
MSRTQAAPVRTVLTVAVIVAASGALALRASVLGAHPVPAGVQTSLLALLYVSIAAAALLPALLPALRPALRPGEATGHVATALGLGLTAVFVAWRTAGPTAPIALAPAALPLSVAAAIAEEALFRRLVYAHLRRWGVPAAIGGAAVFFALAHVPAYGLAAFPVDLGAGLLFGWQRWAAGTWTVPAATHAAANLLVMIR